MTPEQKRGYMAAIDAAARALRDVQHAAIVTTRGLDQVAALNETLLDLNAEIRRTRAVKPRPSVPPNPAPLDTRPMRPSYTGD